MMQHLVGTIVTREFVAQALTLFDSIDTHCGQETRPVCLCLDDESYQLLEELAGPRLARLREKDCVDEAAISRREVLSKAEYCWLLKPYFLEAMMGLVSEGGWVSYLDADILLIRDFTELFETRSASALFTPHRFSPDLADWEETVGTHNAGYASIKKSETGMSIVKEWQRKCLARPPANLRNGETFDQKILDSLVNSFDAAESLVAEIGMNLAPWNMRSAILAAQLDGRDLRVNGNPLYFFHFQGLKMYGAALFETHFGEFSVDCGWLQHLYKTYMRKLSVQYRKLANIYPDYRNNGKPFWKLANIRRLVSQLIRTGRVNLKLLP